MKISVRYSPSSKSKLERLNGQRPTTAELEGELAEEKKRNNTRITVRGTLLTLGTVAACAVLVATLWLPVLRIYGNSMTPTLQEGDLVVSVKQNSFQTGDIIAFYYNNKILVKRVIAGPGDYVDIDEDGNVYVNGTLLEEEYLSEKALGETDLDYPFQVPDNRWFVMGDHRSVSLDSRTKAIGTIAEDQIVGKLVTRIWPLG